MDIAAEIFERPAVKELLEDVRSGKVYGILVKDFSRFGRNLIEVGDYIEKIFPLLMYGLLLLIITLTVRIMTEQRRIWTFLFRI